ncbi:hypothetical protein E2542_SST15816 [Spatholobus suberectus]|nr:hypothetical protein E2542_SST15816 [Spatholobus suberectus]
MAPNQEYPKAAKFKGKGLRNLPEMEILFKDTVVTGHNAWAPSEDLEQGGERVEANDGIDTPMIEEQDVEELDMHDEEITSLSTQRPKRKRGRKDNRRGSVGRRMCEQFDRIIESFSDTITNVPNIFDCLEMLKKLQGLEYGSETHIIGIRLMKSKSNRETFVLMDDLILQLNWIKSHTLADVSRH